MSSTSSSRELALLARALSWIRRCVAISASVRSTSWVSSSWVSFASEVGSISPRHNGRNSTIAAPGRRRGGRGGSTSWIGASTEVLCRRPNLIVVLSLSDAVSHRRLHPDGLGVVERSGVLSTGNAAAACAAESNNSLVKSAIQSGGPPTGFAAFSTNFGRSGIAMSTGIFSASSTCRRDMPRAGSCD